MYNKDAVKERVKCIDFLEPSKGNGMYVCPFCGSGTGKHETGALRYYPETNTFYCHACGAGGDVIKLYQQVKNVDFQHALTELAEMAGLGARESGFPGRGNTGAYPAAGSSQKALQAAIQAPIQEQDFTSYCGQCRERLADPAAVAYLQGRGISPETAAAYGLGYDPAADPANAPGGAGTVLHPCGRIIIPTCKGHYTGRSINPETPKGYEKMNSKGSSPGIFPDGWEGWLTGEKSVFICEGAFDALSVLEAGVPAIALNSANNADRFLQRLEAVGQTETAFLLALDTDKAGQKAAGTIRGGLDKLHIAHMDTDICCGCKDPNEALLADRDGFLSAVRDAVNTASGKPDSVGYYIDNLMSGDILTFRAGVKTGFDNLDRQTGGLYEGLYCIAAISSLGKTTFAAQMADQIAAGGNDVLFFSLEQSRLELTAKSLARLEARADLVNADTSLSIRRGYNLERTTAVAAQYRTSAGDRLSIIEGNFGCNTSYIRDYVRRYIERNGVRPVVFIDYLQILQGDDKQTRREMVDSCVTDLKRMSRDNGLTVFVISAVNRSNYLTPIDFESLKESGGIEYTCDVIWGLQLACLNEDLFNDAGKDIVKKRERVKAAKAATPREIELTCLKNRYGIANFSLWYKYYPANDLFLPCEPGDLSVRIDTGGDIYSSKRRRK